MSNTQDALPKEIQVPDIKLEKKSHWTTTKWWITIYADEKLGIQKDVSVHRINGGYDAGKAVEEWYIDGVKKKFNTAAELVTHYNRLKTLPQ